MKINQKELLQELSAKTQSATAAVQQLELLSIEQLNFKRDEKAWSVLECLEHLNLYGDFYLPRLAEIVKNAPPLPNAGQNWLKTGWLGGYFAEAMRPKNGQISNKMGTFKDKNPAGSRLDLSNLRKFLSQQQQLADILQAAERVDLNGNRCPITLSRFIRLKLGDTLRFFTYHIERHILQAQRAYTTQS